MRRWPKPGARTATASIVPCWLFCTSMPSAGAVDLLGQDDQRLGPAMTWPIAPMSSWTEEIGCVVMRTYGFSKHRLHPHPVADEVRRHVAVLDVQALDEVDGDARQLALLDGHDAVLADAMQRLGDGAADALVLLRRDRRDLAQVVAALDRARRRAAARRPGAAASSMPRRSCIGLTPSSSTRMPSRMMRLREQRRRRRAVAGQLGRLAGHLAHELGAHVLKLVGELDLARDRHAVVRDRRRAGQALQHDVAALRPQRHLDRVGEDVDALLAGAGARRS